MQDDQLPPGSRYAGFWVRLVAAVIDVLIISAIIIVAAYFIYGPSYWLRPPGTVFLGTADALLQMLLPLVLLILFWHYRSATPGKMIFAAKIVDARSGMKPTLAQWIVRYLAYLVSTLPLGLGFLWIAFDRRKQAWHDKLARTVVIRPR